MTTGNFLLGFTFICIAAVATYYNIAIVTYVCCIVGMAALAPFLVEINNEIWLRVDRWVEDMEKFKRGE